MKLILDGDRWIFQCQYNEREVARAAGFRWDAARKIWWTGEALKAAKLSAFVEGDNLPTLVAAAKLAEAQAVAAAELRVVSRELSSAKDADIEIPAPEGHEYLPFQKAGIAYALKRRGTLIGDEMGLGKTIQALGFINAEPSIRRALVVCPASLKINWLREASRWLALPTRIVVLDSKATALPEADRLLVIANYDIVEKLRAFLLREEWDLIVLDESSYLKSPRKKTKRVAAILGREKTPSKPGLSPFKAARWLALDGTPIRNRPCELWNMASLLDPDGLGKS
ncbi:MAG: SNF2-related protein, partial [Myxococcota bacterium]